jgi:hypothetical protein
MGRAVDEVHKRLTREWSGTGTLVRRAFRITTVVAVGMLLAMMFGYISSRTFNRMLERTDFSDETPLNWLVWGLRGHNVIAAVVLFILLALGVLVSVRTMLVHTSARGRRADAAIRQRLSAIAGRFDLADRWVLSTWLMLILAAILVGTWWTYAPYLKVLSTPVSSLERSALALLGAAGEDYRHTYEIVMTLLAIAASAVTLWLLRDSPEPRDASHRLVIAGGSAVAILALISLHVPYRFFHGESFERAMWNGAECYVIGQRAANVLLFCPQLEQRIEVVEESDESVKRTRQFERNLFRTFSP